MHFSASRSLMQPLLDCKLYLTQGPYDLGTSSSSANQCILGNVYLRSNLSRNHIVTMANGEVRSTNSMLCEGRDTPREPVCNKPVSTLEQVSGSALSCTCTRNAKLFDPFCRCLDLSSIAGRLGQTDQADLRLTCKSWRDSCPQQHRVVLRHEEGWEEVAKQLKKICPETLIVLRSMTSNRC